FADDGPDVVARVLEGVGQVLDDGRLWVRIREEGKEFCRQALGRSSQRHQHLDDVITGEVSRLAHEGLWSAVEVARDKHRLRRIAELLAALQRPTGECASRLTDVVLA